ncbi:MAG: hypothetical protein Q8P82_02150 [bacterium]|nr:hypothetical protein [bacterium]
MVNATRIEIDGVSTVVRPSAVKHRSGGWFPVIKYRDGRKWMILYTVPQAVFDTLAQARSVAAALITATS